MAMIGPPEAWLAALPATLDDDCAGKAPANSSPDPQMLPATPANTLRFTAGMRGPLEITCQRHYRTICRAATQPSEGSDFSTSGGRRCERRGPTPAATASPLRPRLFASGVASPGPAPVDVNPLLR